MTGKTITSPGAPLGRPDLPERLTASRAARELELKRGEFDLAVRLGHIRTVLEPACGPEPPGAVGARRRVTRDEIERLRGAPGFPTALRARVRTVSAPQAAREFGITTERFTRLARLGLLTPIDFYVNRYRAVVWLYLAEDLRLFVDREQNRPLLTDRLSEVMRSRLDSGVDLRARNWRGRHAGLLLRLAEDAWSRAAVPASLLDADELADIVPAPHERAHLAARAPERPHQGPPGSPAADVVDALLTATEPEEIAWLRASLTLGLAEARKEQAAPRPATPPQPLGRPDGPRPAFRAAGGPPTVEEPSYRAKPPGASGGESPGRPGRFLGWFRRRRE